MKHRIVVLGAGYAGAFAAGNLARRLSSSDIEITVVNAVPDFVERMRLHQLAAGQDLAVRSLADVFAGTGVRLRLARVTGIDPERRTVAVTGEDGEGELGYDTLLYALGSSVAHHDVPGAAEYAFDVTGRASALRLRERLAALGEGGTVLVVGEGLTGIETATELAESRPDLSVALAARGEPGAWLSAKARRHLRRAFDRLGVTVHEHTAIEAVEPARAIATDGRSLPADATVWSAGFAVHPWRPPLVWRSRRTAGSSSTAPCARSRTRTSTPPVTPPTRSGTTGGRCRCPAPRPASPTCRRPRRSSRGSRATRSR